VIESYIVLAGRIHKPGFAERVGRLDCFCEGLLCSVPAVRMQGGRRQKVVVLFIHAGAQPNPFVAIDAPMLHHRLGVDPSRLPIAFVQQGFGLRGPKYPSENHSPFCAAIYFSMMMAETFPTVAAK